MSPAVYFPIQSRRSTEMARGRTRAGWLVQLHRLYRVLESEREIFTPTKGKNGESPLLRYIKRPRGAEPRHSLNPEHAGGYLLAWV